MESGGFAVDSGGLWWTLADSAGIGRNWAELAWNLVVLTEMGVETWRVDACSRVLLRSSSAVRGVSVGGCLARSRGGAARPSRGRRRAVGLLS